MMKFAVFRDRRSTKGWIPPIRSRLFYTIKIFELNFDFWTINERTSVVMEPEMKYVASTCCIDICSLSPMKWFLSEQVILFSKRWIMTPFGWKWRYCEKVPHFGGSLNLKFLTLMNQESPTLRNIQPVRIPN